MTDVQQALEALDDLLDRLSACLEAERMALKIRKNKELGDLSEKKLDLVNAIAKFDLAALKASVEALPSDRHQIRKSCEQHHTLVVQKAKSIRDYNLVNGLIVRRTQQSTVELLRILSGKPRNGLYGTSGTTVDTQALSGGTIAKA
ncbi:MAG: flagellar export chaperone FlgN [Pseudomonadota bacterium]